MKRVLPICTVLLFAVLSCAGTAARRMPSLRLMPMPENVVLNPGRLTIDAGFRVHWTGRRDPVLVKAVDRLYERLEKKTGIPLALAAEVAPEQTGAVLQIAVSGPVETTQSLETDESYKLHVTERGAGLSAVSPTGILRGIETFLQLVELGEESFYVPCIRIEDRPRFRWRGLHIDVCRHWMPAAVIRRNLDAMAAVKLNVFHWHLSDDQGFRIQSLKFPKLHEMGSDGRYYTQAEVREIVQYAAERGIRVIPEFDMPGHATSWVVGYPELASAPGPYRIERSWAAGEPCMDPTRESTYAFLDAFIGEMAGLFPDKFFHVGGDEVHPKQWNSSTRIRAFMKEKGFKANRDLQAYFSRRMHQILAKHGKKMMGWDEIIHPDLPKSTLIQLWRRQPTPAELAGQGFSGILSRGYYLDAMEPASYHYGIDPLGKDAAKLTAAERARILGGEACMWAEFVTAENIDSRIWPRAAAIAERFWSPADLTDTEDMYRRLDIISRELESLGLRHRANYAAMMRRLAGNGETGPLERLAELVVPTRLGIRMKSRKYTSLTSLNRMVDTVLPESAEARKFDDSVRKHLAGPSDPEQLRQLRQTLTGWRENEQQVRPILARSSLLREVQPLSETIAELCARGLQALEYIERRQKAPAGWHEEVSDLIGRAEKPQAEMLPAITAAIKRLAEAVD